MLILLVSTAIVAGAGEGAQKPAGDPVTYRALAREFAAGSYAESTPLTSVSSLVIRRNNDKFYYRYEIATDDGGSFIAAGPVRFVGDRLVLAVETLKQNRDFEIDGRHYAINDVMNFTLLKVGNLIYLIMESQLARFCNEVNLGTEPRRTRDGDYLFRELNGKGPTTATRELPSQVEKMILVKPVVGTVVSVGEGQAKIDLGERDRVWKGMVLFCEPEEETGKGSFRWSKKDSKKLRVLLRVVEVRDTSCVAEIREVPPRRGSIVVRQGDKVYSRIPDSADKSGIKSGLDALDEERTEVPKSTGRQKGAAKKDYHVGFGLVTAARSLPGLAAGEVGGRHKASGSN